jgi:SAM-dependent methyltransferase
MTVTEAVHGALVHPRRVHVIAEHAARLVPPGAQVLDIGTGDGRIAATLSQRRPDIRIAGLDVLVRKQTTIPVTWYDGRVIPMPEASVDVVTLFDVLHHADDPPMLLSEAARVARSCIVLKDHLCEGRLGRAILRLMDDVGNRRHGVALPHHYWSSRQWSAVIDRLKLARRVWEVGDLGLYPWPANLIFGGRLHVLARLDVRKQV